jgi:two-component system LytT family response regulator
MSYRTLIVDDEQAARGRLRSLLQKHSSVIEIIGEAEDGRDALEKIESMRPEVVFLDINLPFADAFTISEHITYDPHIIFVTAFDNYAIKAFECAALDYLLKPVEPERLVKTIERLCKVNTANPVRKTISELYERMNQAPITRIQVRTGNEIQFISINEIVCFEAEDYYCAVYTDQKKKHLIRISLNELEHTLPTDQFMRIHRKYIVSISHVKKIRSTAGATAQIILDNSLPISLPVSRNYVSKIREILRKH